MNHASWSTSERQKALITWTFALIGRSDPIAFGRLLRVLTALV